MTSSWAQLWDLERRVLSPFIPHGAMGDSVKRSTTTSRGMLVSFRVSWPRRSKQRIVAYDCFQS